ncbi:MAG: hypothetical protein KC731_24270, partial [Myxococcales bacterium]|nr:hypothetical protein [Myxococcales bacterium]
MPHPAPDDHLPDLDPSIVEDDELLWEAIDQLLVDDPQLRRLQRWIADWQVVLRSSTDGEGWRVYMLIEELANEKAELALTTVARWAFEHGVKSGGPRAVGREPDGVARLPGDHHLEH